MLPIESSPGWVRREGGEGHKNHRANLGDCMCVCAGGGGDSLVLWSLCERGCTGVWCDVLDRWCEGVGMLRQQVTLFVYGLCGLIA